VAAIMVAGLLGCNHATGLAGPGPGPGADGGGPGVPSGGNGDGGACRPRQVSMPTEHRPAPPAPCAPPVVTPCTQPGTLGCSDDSQCNSGFDGRCMQVNGACGCIYDACRTDADCGASSDCDCDPEPRSRVPNPVTAVCVASNCRSDADCGPHGFCSPSKSEQDFCGPIVTGWFCHTAQDDCGIDADCTSSGCGRSLQACTYAPELGHWACTDIGICSG
jgi:hypothetical protein